MNAYSIKFKILIYVAAILLSILSNKDANATSCFSLYKYYFYIDQSGIIDGFYLDKKSVSAVGCENLEYVVPFNEKEFSYVTAVISRNKQKQESGVYLIETSSFLYESGPVKLNRLGNDIRDFYNLRNELKLETKISHIFYYGKYIAIALVLVLVFLSVFGSYKGKASIEETTQPAQQIYHAGGLEFCMSRRKDLMRAIISVSLVMICSLVIL